MRSWPVVLAALLLAAACMSPRKSVDSLRVGLDIAPAVDAALTEAADEDLAAATDLASDEDLATQPDVLLADLAVDDVGDAVDGQAVMDAAETVGTDATAVDAGVAEIDGAGDVAGGSCPAPCDDGNSCTDDSCDAKTGCVHVPNTKPCQDGNPCTNADLCANGKCKGVPQNPAVSCNDANPCTTEGCSPVSGCTHTAIGGGCEDGNPCTVGDACLQGQCAAGGNMCTCTGDADCASKDDGNACNGMLACDKSSAPYTCKVKPGSIVQCDASKNTDCLQYGCLPSTGACVATPAVDGTACSDGSKCTGADACSKGGCKPGGVVKCDDSNPCTDDSCDPVGGCQHAANSAACTDGNACTVGDVCAAKACKPGPLLDGDSDGFAAKSCGGTDCDDSKNSVNPGVPEACTTTGVDDNCNGKTDEGCTPLNAVGCGKDGDICGDGKGACSAGHCFSTDSKGYKWTLVPAGPFWMGCNAAVDSDCSGNEKPQHLVDMSAYWLGVYEVTVANYKACVDGSGSGCATPQANVNYATWGVPAKEQYPVNYVNWMQSQSYCKWLGGDLPTEAQWEKAAKGGCEVYAGKDCKMAEPEYPWGNTAPGCGLQAVFTDVTGNGCGTDSTYAVGTGAAQGQSPYGAFDMAGNVLEWTLDWRDEDFYSTAVATLKDAVNSIGKSTRVVRGGSAFHGWGDLRASYRYAGAPSTALHTMGVRCVKSTTP